MEMNDKGMKSFIHDPLSWNENFSKCNKRSKIIAISGGFDPVHVGHIKMIDEAAKYGGVVVIVNSDKWLRRKKGFVFMPFEERLVIMASLKGVINVVGVDDSDETVCEALRKLEPDMFGNGGDRTKENTPEQKVCEELGIKIVFNLGGEKIQSSSDLFTNSIKNRGLNLRQEQYLANYGLDF